jgi:hypothetical protein
MNKADDRIEVLFGTASLAGPQDAVLAAPAEFARHRAGCACCAGRGALAAALGHLFIARARGEVAYFRRVVVTGADAAARASLAADGLVAARFRVG